MDPRLKNIIDNFDTWKIGLDDSFQFHCTECGKCCINREDILLTPRDLFNASKSLDMTPPAFVHEYCECYIGQDSRLPIVRLQPRGSIKRCPLLKDRRCRIHLAKPAVCAMFPIGRAVALDKTSGNSSAISSGHVQYIINPIDCGDKSETHTVREWLTAFGIPVEDEYFLKWQGFIVEVSMFIREAEEKLSDELLDTLWKMIYVHAYLDYDSESDFMPQFERNTEDLLKAIRKLEDLMGKAS